MRRQTARDIAISVVIGTAALLLFHADHLARTYAGFDDPYWLLHLAVDSSYILIYGGLAYIALQGRRIWQQRRQEKRSDSGADD